MKTHIYKQWIIIKQSLLKTCFINSVYKAKGMTEKASKNSHSNFDYLNSTTKIKCWCNDPNEVQYYDTTYKTIQQYKEQN